MAWQFQERLRRIFQPDRALLVLQRFSKHPLRLLPVPRLLRGLPPCLHPRAPVAAREAVFHLGAPRGEAAAGAEEFERVRLPDRPGTLQPQVAAEADTRTDRRLG